MRNFSVDLDSLARTVSGRVFKLSEVKDKIEKVAFDVVRMKDGAPDELWQIQDADDGQYIVALYDEKEDKVAEASAPSPWNVIVKNADIHFFYKNDHVCKVTGGSLGFDDSDIHLARKYLPTKLASNKSLVKSLLSDIDESSRQIILNKYPELA